MPYLTTPQKATLLQLLQDAGLAATEPYGASNLLNAPTEVPNDPAPQIPLPLSWYAIVAGIEPATVSKLDASSLAGNFQTYVNSGDRAKANEVLTWWQKGNVITSDEYATLHSLANSTQDQPGWPATKIGPSLFAAAFPGFMVNIDGNDVDRCHAALIIEARS